MEDQADQPVASSTPAYPNSGRLSAFGQPADEQRADRHAAEEDDEDDDLSVRAVADEEAEVARPDRLVDEPRRAGKDEDRVEESEHALSTAYRRRARNTLWR